MAVALWHLGIGFILGVIVGGLAYALWFWWTIWRAWRG